MAKTSKVTPTGVAGRESVSPSGADLGLLAMFTAAALVAVSAVAGAQMQQVQRLAVSVAGAVMVGLPMGIAIISRRSPVPRAPYPHLLAAACLLTLLTALGTVSPGRTTDRLLELSCGFFVLVTMLAAARRSPLLAASAASAGIAAGGLAASAVAAHEYAQHYRIDDPLWRVFGTFYNPGFLSGYLVLSIPATLALLAVSRHRVATLGLSFAAILQIAAVALTGARAGILALVVGLAVLGLMAMVSGLLRSGAAARVAVVLLLALVAAVAVGRPTGGRVQKATEEGHSFTFRVYTWKATAAMAAAQPVTGTGPGTFEVAFYPYSIAGYTRLAHSNLLQGAAEHGLVPWALQLAWWGLVLWSGMRMLAARVLERDESWLMSGFLAACAATTVRSAFDSDWWCLPILLACAAATAAIAGFVDAPVPAGASRRTVGLALLVAAVLAALPGAAALKSASEASLAEAQEARDMWSQAEVSWRSSAASAPWYVQPRLRAAQYQAMAEGGFPQQVRQEMDRLKKLEPTNPKIPRSQAELALRAGMEEAAATYMQQASKLDPNSPRLLLELAQTLESIGRREEAVRLYRKMLEVEASPYGKVRAIPQLIEPAYAWAHAEVGDELALSRETGEEAKKHWQAAASLLRKYFKSVLDNSPMLDAAGLRDEDLEKEGRELQSRLRRKLQSP